MSVDLLNGRIHSINPTTQTALYSNGPSESWVVIPLDVALRIRDEQLKLFKQMGVI